MNDSLQTCPIHKLLIKYCIPAIVSMMTVSLYNTVDRVFIGHIPDIGSLALTSLGTVMPFITIILACELLITYGAIANLSIKLGEKNQLMAEKILNQVPGLGVMISLLLMIIFFIFKTPLLELFGANKIILPLASEYLNVMILGIPFYIIIHSTCEIVCKVTLEKRKSNQMDRSFTLINNTNQLMNTNYSVTNKAVCF